MERGIKALLFLILREARLQLTDELIGDLHERSTPGRTDEDLQRIQELLSLPKNKEASEPPGSQ